MATTTKFMLTAFAGLAVATTAGAQQDKMAPMGVGEATIYRDVNFSGPAVYVGRANPDLGLNWPVRSVRVKKGTWEICSRTRYRGRCAIVASDDPDLRGRTGFFDNVQSMRPMGGPQILPPVGPQPPTPPAPPAGTSLRGMGAEFFPAPGQYGVRILSCPNGDSTANCAARTADQFCQSAGWNGSTSESQETVNRRVYLADVLCVRSGY